MNSYAQLSREQRYQIYAILNTAHKQTQITSVLGGGIKPPSVENSDGTVGVEVIGRIKPIAGLKHDLE